MQSPLLRLTIRVAVFTCLVSSLNAADSSPSPSADPNKWTDSNGLYFRRSKTGHVTNYDESKVGTYTLPDPLVLQNGKPVTDADTWITQRRPEILELYRSQIYGRVPTNPPKVTIEEGVTDTKAVNGTAIFKSVALHFGDQVDGPTLHVSIFLPAKATGPVPMLLHMVFNAPPTPESMATQSAATDKPSEAGPIADILAHGFGYAVFRYTEIEPDGTNGKQPGVREVTHAAAGPDAKPIGDEWGTISAWAWGASQVLDYLATQPAIDTKRVALIGHSRLGKTALWAGAQDERFALIFASCSGEMGASLSRRDYGETVDDMATNSVHQFATNFEKYLDDWKALPVDSHMLIALNAPRPVLITGGTKDQWADPRGEFLAEVAAGPVYKLLGKKDLGTNEFPPVDTPMITGDLAFNYHTGAHAILPSDWKVFLDFADAHFKQK